MRSRRIGGTSVLFGVIEDICQSRWPHDLRREVFSRSKAEIMCSNATQGMNICVRIYSVFMLSCVQVAALRRADHSSKES
jgi:hypothetical protein